jgi:hypothetical protein
MRETMLILHFIGLSMGLGTSFAHAFLGMATSKMSPDEVVKFRVHSLVLSNMGKCGYCIVGCFRIVFNNSFLVSINFHAVVNGQACAGSHIDCAHQYD